jgi:5-methylcytosine-specific restriction protein B
VARYCGGPRDLIDQTADTVRRDCLIDNGSVFLPDQAIWTRENFEDLYDAFVGNPIHDKRRFDEKFREQLAEAKPDSRRLASELLLTYVLFVNGLLRPRTKRDLIELPLTINDEQLPDDHPAVRALEQGIGNPGSGFSMYRPDELTFLIELGRRLKALDEDARRDLLADDAPWKFGEWVDEEVPGADSRQMRHILLHLLYPDHYERVGSGRHKAQIAQTFADLVEEDEVGEDRLIFAVRQRLETLLEDKVPDVSKLDFYGSPLVEAWRGGSGTELDAIDFKRQIVLYGPPGTGKTHEAKQLAARLIRRAALSQWGAAEYFERRDAVEQAAERNVRRLQLHPAYSYEEFIRGLHLDDGGRTVYRPGYLARLVHDMEAERAAAERPLPFVLILDEMNRADLSRVFGEAFSLLEDRDVTIDLPLSHAGDGSRTASEDDVPVDRLRLPSDLYFIGTMNLIDQSVEQIDFALRRRFLWKPMRFDKEALVEVVRTKWDDEIEKVAWERVEDEMLAVADAAERLNDAIHESPVLGTQYEIGHTYFFDIVPLVKRSLRTRGASRRRSFLWTGNGKPREPLQNLWDLSLKPLLEQYLAGLDPTEQERELGTFSTAFLQAPGE